MRKIIFIFVLLLLVGCTSSSRFGDSQKFVYTGRPVESTDGNFITKIPSDWLVVEDNDDSSLFIFTNSELNFILSLKLISGEKLEYNNILSALRARVKVENNPLLISPVAEFFDVQGFYYTVQDNSLYNIFVYETDGLFWESKLYLEKSALNKKEQLFRLQAEILKNIVKN
ncbi:MAG: hypothetical protein SCALA702_10360 [Melioribacteraceae bacterium]|nr:MAG: hypothetical protein SCALA702_10360 [Melioribacteraceae bacterium]